METQLISEKVDIGELTKTYQISDPITFQKYLSAVWEDLSKRSKNPKKGIEKLTFINYYKLPGIISDRLFSVFDRDKNGFLDNSEFVLGMKTLFARGETFNSLAKFIFKIYDFDRDGIIKKENVKLILSYIPLNKRKSNKNISDIVHEEFQDRIQSQNELVEILNIAFGKKDTLSYDKYIYLIEKINSDIFLLVLTILLEKGPVTKDTINLFMKKEKLTPEEKINRTPKIISHMIASPSMNSRFISPNLKKKASINIKNNMLLKYAANTEQKNSLFSKKNKEINKFDIQNKNLEKENEQTKIIRKNLENLEDISTPTNNFTFNKYNEKNSFLIPNKKKEKEELIIDEDEKSIIKYEGYMLKITEDKKIKKVYYRLIGKDLYYFKKKNI